MENRTRAFFKLPFADFDYEAALPKYDLHGHRRSTLELCVVGTETDIKKFEVDFEGVVRV